MAIINSIIIDCAATLAASINSAPSKETSASSWHIRAIVLEDFGRIKFFDFDAANLLP